MIKITKVQIKDYKIIFVIIVENKNHPLVNILIVLAIKTVFKVKIMQYPMI